MASSLAAVKGGAKQSIAETAALETDGGAGGRNEKASGAT
jgi:hypothetical protein